MPSLLNKNVTSRALWTGLQAVIALAITVLSGLSAWWAAPIAIALSAVKTNVVDRLAIRREAAGQSGP